MTTLKSKELSHKFAVAPQNEEKLVQKKKKKPLTPPETKRISHSWPHHSQALYDERTKPSQWPQKPPKCTYRC